MILAAMLILAAPAQATPLKLYQVLILVGWFVVVPILVALAVWQTKKTDRSWEELKREIELWRRFHE